MLNNKVKENNNIMDKEKIESNYINFLSKFNLDEEEIENYNNYLSDYSMNLKDIVNHLYQNDIISEDMNNVVKLGYIEDIQDFTVYVNIQKEKYTFGILFKEEKDEEYN